MKNEFVYHQLYTKKEIQDVLGGNSQVAIATNNHDVLHMSIDAKLNPSFGMMRPTLKLDDNVFTYLVGDQGKIVSAAKDLLKFKDTFPVFLKTKKKYTNEVRWKFIGNFKYENHSFDRDQVEFHQKPAELKSERIAFIVFIRQVDKGESQDAFLNNQKQAA